MGIRRIGMRVGCVVDFGLKGKGVGGLNGMDGGGGNNDERLVELDFRMLISNDLEWRGISALSLGEDLGSLILLCTHATAPYYRHP